SAAHTGRFHLGHPARLTGTPQHRHPANARMGLSLPNLISVGRIILVPLIVWLIVSDRMLAAAVVFLLAGISDAVDGFIAKRFNQTTELGAYLDPLADKLLLVSIYVSLGFLDHLQPWLVITVVSRDILIVGAFLLSWVLARPVEVRPLVVSKINTVAQIVLAAVVLANAGLNLSVGDAIFALSLAVAILTLASGGAYLTEWL